MRVLYFAPVSGTGSDLPQADSFRDALKFFAPIDLIDARQAFDFRGWGDLNTYHDDYADAFDLILLCAPAMPPEKKSCFLGALNKYTKRIDARPVIAYYNDPDMSASFNLLQSGAVYAHRSTEHVGVLATYLQRAFTGIAPAISGPAPYEVGPVRIDYTYQQVCVDGVDVYMTGSQFELLAFLAQRKGRPCTKESLMIGLNKNEDTDAKLIDVYVCKIRSLLNEANPACPDAGDRALRTIWGRGYAMAKDQSAYDADLPGKGNKVLALPAKKAVSGGGPPTRAVARPA